MSVLAQFLGAWAVGIPAVLLAAEVDEAFALALAVPGVLLLGAAVRALTNDRAWRRFLAAVRFYPQGRTARMCFGGVTFMLGTGWLFGGLVGLLVVLGLDEPR